MEDYKQASLNKLQMLFLVIFNLKMLSTYMENTLYKLILDQSQNFLKSLFYTLESFEWSKKPSHATIPLNSN